MILIDTHIWIWAVQDTGRLSPAQADALANATDGVLLSAISLWETAFLIQRGRIDTNLKAIDWINKALTVGAISVVELTPAIVCESVALPEPFHKDPADRIIAATSRVLGLPLLTVDRALLNSPHVQTIE